MQIRIVILFIVIGLPLKSPFTDFDASASAQVPSTAAQAAEVLDLRKFERVDAVEEPMNVSISQLSYKAKGKIPELAKKLQANFKKAGCTELPAAVMTDDYGSANYQKAGFTWSLSLSPLSPMETMVVIINHGNVDLAKLPLPKEIKMQTALPAVTMFETSLSPEDTIELCRRHLSQHGWEPFGDTTVSCFLKNNAVKLQVFATASPVQQGKTSGQLTSELISADLPAPPYHGMLQWSESTKRMIFDSELSQQELIKNLKASLSKWEWSATTEQPVKIAFRDHLIFRNPKKEYLELTFQTVDGKTRCEMMYQTAEEFAEQEERARTAVEKKQMQAKQAEEKKNSADAISIPSPEGAKISNSSAKSIEFSLTSGKAKESLTNWLAVMEERGWKAKAIVDTKEVGEYELSNEEAKLSVSLIDPGFIPGTITIRSTADEKLQVEQ